jgi:hypothetical protein
VVRPLSTNQRRSYLRCSLCACAGALMLMPIALPPDLQAESSPTPATAHHERLSLDAQKVPTVHIVRNPFESVDATASASGPNAANGAAPGPTVAAVVLGSAPKALINEGGNVATIGVGSIVAGRKVVSIDSGGVRLEDGTLLPFGIAPQ